MHLIHVILTMVEQKALQQHMCRHMSAARAPQLLQSGPKHPRDGLQQPRQPDLLHCCPTPPSRYLHLCCSTKTEYARAEPPKPPMLCACADTVSPGMRKYLTTTHAHMMWMFECRLAASPQSTSAVARTNPTAHQPIEQCNHFS